MDERTDTTAMLNLQMSFEQKA